MSRKETCKKAIHFNTPEYVPLMYYGTSRAEKSDAIMIAVQDMFCGENKLRTEWGFEWAENGTNYKFGISDKPAFKDWSELPSYVPLDPERKGRFDQAIEVMKQYPDRYYIADFLLSGFTIASFIRGFEDFLMDMYLDRANVEALLDLVCDTENKLMKKCAEVGFDAICLADDWGTQNSLLISLDMWREIFLPRYKRQIEYAHSIGLDVMFHSCGYIRDIIPYLIEAKLDILNPGQANLNGIEYLGEHFAGQICFACPVGYQTTAITGTASDVENEIKNYLKYFSTPKGGYFGMVNSKNALTVLGAPEENEEMMLCTYEKYCGKR